MVAFAAPPNLEALRGALQQVCAEWFGGDAALLAEMLETASKGTLGTLGNVSRGALKNKRKKKSDVATTVAEPVSYSSKPRECAFINNKKDLPSSFIYSCSIRR